MKFIFPISYITKRENVGSLVIPIIIYLVIGSVFGFVNLLLGWIPVVGWLVGLITGMIGLYLLIGIIICIVRFFE